MSEASGFGRSWLLSFADLTSLLLAFFLMLYASADMGPATWSRVRQSLSGQFHPGRAEEGGDVARTPLSRRAVPGLDPDYLRHVVAMRLASDPTLADVAVEARPGAVAIMLGEGIFAAIGKAALTDEARARLAALAAHLQYFGNRIEVHGFTATPDEGDGPWTLPVTRAIAVANELKRQGHPHHVASLGFAGPARVEIVIREDKR
jgi:chemotaxis protein MotB